MTTITKTTCDRCHCKMDLIAGLYEDPTCPPCRLEEHLVLEATGAVLDVGSGMARYHRALWESTEGQLDFLEAHLPYVVAHKPPPEASVFIGKAENILPLLKEDSYDTAIAIDFPEHLDVETAVHVVTHMKRVAKKVILFVPDGIHPQDKDAYEMGADHLQTHRSTWGSDALGHDGSELQVADALTKHAFEGFAVERWADFHAHATSQSATGAKSSSALFCVWRRA